MSTHTPNRTHAFAAHLTWDGNHGTGTATYAGYGREYRIGFAGKPTIAGSADVAFRGRPDRPNPEELLVAALSACHMLAYLALCARNGVRVVAYEDAASGTLAFDDDGGRFTEVVLAPKVTVATDADRALALRLHDTAHERCFIARSCSVPVHHHATVTVAAASEVPA